MKTNPHGRTYASYRHLAWIACCSTLLLGACIGDVGGSDEQGGNVEIYSAAAVQDDLYNAGLSPDDDEAEPDEDGAGSVERGWIAESSSGTGRLASLRGIWAQPFAQVAVGEPLLFASRATSAAGDADGVSTRITIISPDGDSSSVTETFDLPQGSIAEVYQETAPLEKAGTYTIQSELLDADGEVVDQLPEVKVNVAAIREIMASGLATVMSKAAKFRYSKGCSNRTCLASRGSGDCWAMSDWIWYNLQKKGYNARILQYKTKYSSRHRSVQYVSGGKWVDVPYKKYGVQTLFRATSSRPGLKVIAD